ncbi:MAG: hypothetical protein JXR58_08210, partial [Bacteroidales bacterium]|nr:hypothetical protein [Bacteroidales bacterium]
PQTTNKQNDQQQTTNQPNEQTTNDLTTNEQPQTTNKQTTNNLTTNDKQTTTNDITTNEQTINTLADEILMKVNQIRTSSGVHPSGKPGSLAEEILRKRKEQKDEREKLPKKETEKKAEIPETVIIKAEAPQVEEEISTIAEIVEETQIIPFNEPSFEPELEITTNELNELNEQTTNELNEQQQTTNEQTTNELNELNEQQQTTNEQTTNEPNEQKEQEKPKESKVLNQMSFIDWLTNFKENKGNISQTEEKIPDERKIIDQFIQNQPKLKPKLVAERQEDISLASVTDSEEFVTETLAKIFIKQGHFQKAINVYEKLSLKFPEKSIYFADQIEKIKK